MKHFGIGRELAAGDRLTGAVLRTLGVILQMATDGDVLTRRRIAARRGCHYTLVVLHLELLRQAGLVDFVNGDAGTIRPTCVFLYAEKR